MSDPERIKVNQRALVDKVLARYPEKFAVFRELLQNADDATAREVRIEFQTGDYAQHSAGANRGVDEINGNDLDLNPTEYFKCIVRNNGNPFEIEDWGRLKKIGDGNPGEQKIGAFGVGFYSVFSLTERPRVISGNRSLEMFFGDDGADGYNVDGDALWTLEEDFDKGNEWTSIEMELKNDMRSFVPEPFDLARFLAATMTFMSHLETTSVLSDGEESFKITKSRGEPDNISIPSDMSMRLISEEPTMKIETVSVATQEITVYIADWAVAASTQRASARWPIDDGLTNKFMRRKEPWSPCKTSEVRKIKPPSRESSFTQQSHTAKYAVYSAAVTTSPSEELSMGLRKLTKKNPPDAFKIEVVYFSKEEHDARAEEENDPLGSIFRGPQGLFPRLDRGREYMSRVFIGQSTTQTTGIGGHLSGGFIPTVERGSIDLTNGHIAKWNKELLYVGGFLARLVYETEIKKIPGPLLEDEPTASPPKDDALYVMRYFSFLTSTPDDKVSEILRQAFFNCSKSTSFPILSNSGIRCTKDVRQHDKNFSPFMKGTPVLRPKVPGDPPTLIDTLSTSKYDVPVYKFNDVVKELEARTLQEDEMASLLHWWVETYEKQLDLQDSQAESDERAPDEATMQKCGSLLKSIAKWYMGDSKREMRLSNISKFVDSEVWNRLQQSDPLPPDTLPLSFTKNLKDRNMIVKALGLQGMMVVDWLGHLISPEVDSDHDIRKNAGYSNQVLEKIQGPLSGDSEAKDFMKDVPWIATNQGFRKASEAYFTEADIFNSLPVVTANVLDHRVLLVLTTFGVKSHFDFDEFFAEPVQLNASSTEKMIKYISAEQSFRDKLEDIQKHRVFPSEKGEKYCITELYIPHDDIRELGLPILAWPQRIDSDDEKMLTELGFLKHPPLEKIIEVAGSGDLQIRRAGFKYLSDNFTELYEDDYDPSDHEDVAFIPAVKDDVECVGAYKDVYCDKSWAKMGFLIFDPSVDCKMKGRLKIREVPLPERLIEKFEHSAPRDHSTAENWFAFLAVNRGLTPEDIQQVAQLPIVPIGDHHMALPRECFLGGSQYPNDHHYHRIFNFVDFGEHGNKFLEACGAKAKPECSDIVDTLMKDPYGFLGKTREGEGQEPEKYLAELRSIANGYDKLSDERKGKMRKAPIFVGYRVSRSSNFQLRTASEILIADDLEDRRTFAEVAWLAPQDETLEKLYESVGSDYLSNHITYNVIPSSGSKGDTWPDCENVRRKILEKLPIFLHEYHKQQLKNPSMHYYWDEDSRFLVSDCEDLKVEKRFDFHYWKSPEQPGFKPPYLVSAEITTKPNSPVTLWLKRADEVDMYDVAAALCRLLFQTHKKHDVFTLMAILEMSKEDLKKQGCNVDAITEAHKHAVEEKRRNRGREEEAPNGRRGLHKRKLSNIVHFPLPNFFRRGSGGSGTTGIVEVSTLDLSIVDVMTQLKSGKETEQQVIRNRGHGGASKTLKDVKYCAEQKSTALDPVSNIASTIPFWKHKTAPGTVPMTPLADFTAIINELRGEVFGMKNDNSTFNIFWHPGNPELMGFNRNRLIFLNLAHYISRKDNPQPLSHHVSLPGRGESPPPGRDESLPPSRDESLLSSRAESLLSSRDESLPSSRDESLPPSRGESLPPSRGESLPPGKDEGSPRGRAYIEWYQIIVHEIAHHETPFHDERHELLVSGLSSRFLTSLHKLEAVSEYLGSNAWC